MSNTFGLHNKKRWPSNDTPGSVFGEESKREANVFRSPRGLANASMSGGGFVVSPDVQFEEEGETELAALAREAEEREAAFAELERRGAPPAPPADPSSSRPPVAGGRCIECAKNDGQARFREAYGINVCYDCQKLHKADGGKYQTMTKSKAKDEYLLTDAVLKSLGSLKLPNPHDARFGVMKLYLLTQVEQLALEPLEPNLRHGRAAGKAADAGPDVRRDQRGPHGRARWLVGRR